MQSTKTSLDMLSFFQRVHTVVKTVAPWSILLAALGLMFTYLQLRNDRNLREAILISLVHERIEAARALDQRDGRIARYDAGQIRVLEIIAKMGIKLRHIDLTGVSLADAKLGGIDLRNSNLDCTTLSDSDLSGADLSDTTIRGGSLRDTTLVGTCFKDSSLAHSIFHKTDLTDADFNGTNLNNVQFRNVDLSAARNLSKDEIGKACGRGVKLPDNWTIKPCDNEHKEKRKRYRERCKKRIHG